MKQMGDLDGVVAAQDSSQGDDNVAFADCIHCRPNEAPAARLVINGYQTVVLRHTPIQFCIEAAKPEGVCHMIDVDIGQEDGFAGRYGEIFGIFPIAAFLGPLELRIDVGAENPMLIAENIHDSRVSSEDFYAREEDTVQSIGSHLSVGDTIDGIIIGDAAREVAIGKVAVVNGNGVDTVSRCVASHTCRATVPCLVVVDFTHVEAVLGNAAQAHHTLVAFDVEFGVGMLRQRDNAGVEAVARFGLARRQHAADR